MTIDNEINRIELRDSVIFAEYKKDTIVTLEVAKQAVKDRLLVAQGVSYPLCGDIRNLAKVTDEAREILGSDEAFVGIKILAVITANPIQKLLGNFYLRFKSSKVSTRLFTDKDKAVFWLKNYKTLN